MRDWAKGRRVAIFPDVPGKFKPEHSIIITTGEQRATLQKVIREIIKEFSAGVKKGDENHSLL